MTELLIPLEHARYFYRMPYDSNYDGDTITLDWDFGDQVVASGRRFRLNRLDTPERRGVEKERGTWIGQEVGWLLENCGQVWVRTFVRTRSDLAQRGKYGRYVVEVFLRDPDMSSSSLGWSGPNPTWLNLNGWLIATDRALPKPDWDARPDELRGLALWGAGLDAAA